MSRQSEYDREQGRDEKRGAIESVHDKVSFTISDCGGAHHHTTAREATLSLSRAEVLTWPESPDGGEDIFGRLRNSKSSNYGTIFEERNTVTRNLLDW